VEDVHKGEVDSDRLLDCHHNYCRMKGLRDHMCVMLSGFPLQGIYTWVSAPLSDMSDGLLYSCVVSIVCLV
jgi:hypothetical protein